MYTVSTNEIAFILICYLIVFSYLLWDRKYNHIDVKEEPVEPVTKSPVETKPIYDDNKYRRMSRTRAIVKDGKESLINMSLRHLTLTTKLSDLGKEILNTIKINKEDLSLYLKILEFKVKLNTVIIEDNILDMLLENDTEIINIIPLSFNAMRETVFMDEQHSLRRSVLACPSSSIETRGHHAPSFNYVNYILFIKCRNEQVFGLHLWLDIKKDILKVYPTRYIYTDNNWYTAIDVLNYNRILQLLDRDYNNRVDYIKELSSNYVRRVEVMDIDNDDGTLIPINIHIPKNFA